MKKVYDVIFGMGSACSCTQALREAGLQHASFPFDWVGGPGPLFKARMMVDDYPDWFGPGTLEILPSPKHSFELHCKDRWGFTPLHDFARNEPLESALPRVRAKYRRRIDRLSKLLDGASRTLVVYIDSPEAQGGGAEIVPEMRTILAQRWPNTTFDFLFFQYRQGCSFTQRIDESGDGWRVVSYDYKDRAEEEWRADWHQIGAYLRDEYIVVDYRTEEEKEKWEKAQRTKDWARYKAHSWFEYFCVKFQYKLYKHLRTSLDRRGII